MTGRARIKEIASLANVGSATVDRVIHGRSHVSDATRQKVLQAKSAIESGAWTVRSPRPWHLKVILPEMAGLSTEYLAQRVWSSGECHCRMRIFAKAGACRLSSQTT